jgi:hypothetical protein
MCVCVCVCFVCVFLDDLMGFDKRHLALLIHVHNLIRYACVCVSPIHATFI